MKTLFLFDANGVYKGNHLHRTGNFLPERYTEIEPIKVSENEIAIWTGCEWTTRQKNDAPLVDTQEILFESLKIQRKFLVSNIKVTTHSGKTFDGNEDAQNRMTRNIAALNPMEETVWVLADSTVTKVTREELQEALRLASAAQTEIWTKIY